LKTTRLSCINSTKKKIQRKAKEAHVAFMRIPKPKTREI